jgi:hypothetical protein
MSKDGFMATLMTGSPVPARASAIYPTASGVHRRRRMSPEAGHALEILGHAIEYLADEYAHEGGSFSGSDPRLEAIQLLMAVNRQVYLACPEVPTLGERIRAWLQRHHLQPHHKVKLQH